MLATDPPLCGREASGMRRSVAAMTKNTSLNTKIAEPSANADEVEMLLFALERSRAQFAWKCGGPDAAALRQEHPPSAMTIAGLIKHMAGVEERIIALAVTGRRPAPPWDTIDPGDDPDWEWRTAADDSPEELYSLWHASVERSKAATAGALAGGASTSRRRSRSGAGRPRTCGECWSTCTS